MVIILTLDYELFLNDKTGTVRNCLEKPIKELQKICDKHEFHYTVFVDAAYLYMLNKLKALDCNLEDDFERVCDNLKWIHSRGHDIELHIHPQWYFSSYKNGEWALDWDHYRLADVESDLAIKYFEESKKLLEEVIGKKTTIFRAGGYSLPGFDYESIFRKTGIVADSSVLPGKCEITATHSFDYRGVPSTPYKFTKEVTQPIDDGKYIELPISFARKVFIINYFAIKRGNLLNANNANWGDGGNDPKTGVLNKVRGKLSSFSLFKNPKATIDYQSFFFLREAYKASRENGYLTIIGHPKNFSRASLDFFDSFVDSCKYYGDQFVTAEEYCHLVPVK